ncbi:hypothetical protein CDL15_Pgr016468 [Punica granatum]|uniref:Uncharacterized protein n=1 Tax=Punica granatum TaxID=22663 RepID=A0A218XU39_PUNGR|nr:hypothetical protein CDL15_Pgr016468 [Punica granatum]PKI41430.1 hypothetical protein CRG98_038202 [Punica granatum]
MPPSTPPIVAISSSSTSIPSSPWRLLVCVSDLPESSCFSASSLALPPPAHTFPPFGEVEASSISSDTEHPFSELPPSPCCCGHPISSITSCNYNFSFLLASS